MAKVYLISCRDAGVDCDFQARGSNLEEVMQLCADHAAKHELGGLALLEAAGYPCIAAVEQPDAGICIKQVLHSICSRSSGRPGGSCVSAAPPAPRDRDSK